MYVSHVHVHVKCHLHFSCQMTWYSCTNRVSYSRRISRFRTNLFQNATISQLKAFWGPRSNQKQSQRASFSGGAPPDPTEALYLT